MKAPVRRIAAVAAAVAALATPAAAQAASPGKLLAKYQPVTVFDKNEALRPASADAFVAGARPETIAGVPALNFTACSPPAGLVAVDCYVRAADGARNVVYGRVVKDGRATVLQYWYFYFHNFYSYTYPPSNALWQAHEGDWEVVNVVLAPGGEPRYVGYSQHCLGERRRWSKVERWNGHHPVVHVAIGSHANYFDAGTHPFNVECLRRAGVLDFFRSRGLPLPVDYAFAGAHAGPVRLGTEVTEIERIGDAVDPWWVAFPGIWGEVQYLGGYLDGRSLTVVPLGLSPVGPAFHDVWQEPLATMGTWPAG